MSQRTIGNAYAPCTSVVQVPVGIDSLSYPAWGTSTLRPYLSTAPGGSAVPLVSLGGMAVERSPNAINRDEDMMEVIIAQKPVVEFDDPADTYAAIVPDIYRAQSAASNSFNFDVDRIWVANDYAFRCSASK